MNTYDEMPKHGTPTQLMPGLQRVIAPNPSPMTYWGTNTYIIGGDEVVVIDPGPDDPAHLSALLGVLDGRRVATILVTHSHIDHSALCAKLAAGTGARVLAFGDSLAGRSDIMTDLANQGLSAGGEGVDVAFTPDGILEDGDVIAGDWGEVTAIHTPGHMANHLCFAWRNQLFTGDHIMGWATSLISPPDGDMTSFMHSCDRLRLRDADRYFPGHGAPIDAPKERLNWIVQHRLDRTAQILSALEQGGQSVAALTESIYHDLAPGLLPAAQRNVFAHLIDLCQQRIIFAQPNINFHAKYQLNVPDE
jgi:glyoxylase-like metal-dependent hydrolase (beta-lactamase superfamily II)